VDFHPRATVLTGPNDMGKSSLIKSLIYAFGAEPKMLPEWKATISKILVYFTVDGVSFRILREGSTFTVFSADGKPIGIHTSVTKGLGPWLAGLLNFGIKLTDKQGELITPPPAYLFLPYYFDQDTSWGENWKGFSKLQQIPNWRRDLIEYHVGLKPNDYYTAKGEHLKAKAELGRANAAMAVLKGVRDQIIDEYQEVDFTVDLEAFQEEIKELLVACAKMQKEADRVKNELVGYYTDKIELESQIEVVSGALSEISKDFHFLEKQSDHIDCPTCGAAYEASFSEVFGIARDEGRCEHLLHTLREELGVVVKEIDRMSGQHRKNEADVAHIKSLLDRRQAEVQLKDLIDAESKRKLKSVLQAKFEDANREILRLSESLERLQKKLDAFVDKDRRAELKEQFHQIMRRNLHELSVPDLSSKEMSDVTTPIHTQGSDQPRALLGYGMAILELMRQRSSSVFCPVIIDSPIQQEQDVANHERIVKFIQNRLPSDAQLILGIVDDKGVNFGGTVIRLGDKRRVLRDDEFEDAYAEVFPFVKASLEFDVR
jgi:CII-binding regulator of phage lambda lysogenization HflD